MWDIVFQGSHELWPSNDPKINIVVKIALWDLKPKFRAKQHISMVAGIVLIADYCFGGHFKNMQIG